LLQVFHSSILSNRECEEGVHLERMPRIVFQALGVGPSGSYDDDDDDDDDEHPLRPNWSILP